MPVMYYETRPVMVQALQFTGENIEEGDVLIGLSSTGVHSKQGRR